MRMAPVLLAPLPLTPDSVSEPATLMFDVSSLSLLFDPEILPLAPDAIVIGVAMPPPFHENEPVTVIPPPLMLTLHALGVSLNVKPTSDTVGILSTCAVHSDGSGAAIVTESPVPGTPDGDQFFGSVQECPSPPLFCELPIQV
jgi:hypothetical protein